MREESHLDDMRAAIRGDFERLEERRGEQVLLRPCDQSEEEIETEPACEPALAVLESVALQQTVTSEDARGRVEAEDESRRRVPADVTLQQTVTSDARDEQLKRSWIDRLLGR